MIRAEFSQVVMVKNAAQFGLGLVLWFAVGVAFAYGEVDDKFLGHKYWAGDEWRGQDALPRQATITGLAGISVIYIVNGAIAERTQPITSLLFTLVVMGFAWPVVVGWTWGGGFLSNMDPGFEDIGGVAVIHTFAGVFALVGLFFIRPRLGPAQTAPELVFSNPALICIGSILYFIHLLFLNCVYAGSILSSGKAVFNTWLSAGVCCIVVTILGTLRDWSIATHFVMVLRGFTGGAILVAGVAWNMEPWAAFTFAAVGGTVLFASLWLEDYYRLDDVTKAVSVHLTMGIMGTFGVGLWDKSHGAFHGSDGALLGSQLGGGLVIAFWACAFAAAIFSVCVLLRILRVPAEAETLGLNSVELTLKGFVVLSSHQVHPSSRPLQDTDPTS